MCIRDRNDIYRSFNSKCPEHNCLLWGQIRQHQGKIVKSVNMIANRFVVYNELYLSKHLSSRAAAARWRGGDGCSFPAAHQSGRSTISNISGNSWDLFINVLRVFRTFTLHWGRRSAPHLWDRLDRPHCMRQSTSNIQTNISNLSMISQISHNFPKINFF